VNVSTSFATSPNHWYTRHRLFVGKIEVGPEAEVEVLVRELDLRLVGAHPEVPVQVDPLRSVRVGDVGRGATSPGSPSDHTCMSVKNPGPSLAGEEDVMR
jgi:hypothetical protein